MSIRQAKCRHCGHPTGEAYDDENTEPQLVEALCNMCKISARAGQINDPGRIATTRQHVPIEEHEPHEGEENTGRCPSCGGTEYEIEVVYREYSTLHTDTNGWDCLYFDSTQANQGYGECQPDGPAYCTGCGEASEFDYEIS